MNQTNSKSVTLRNSISKFQVNSIQIRYKYKVYEVVYFILAFFLFKPNGLTEMVPLIDDVYDVIRVIEVPVILILYFRSLNNNYSYKYNITCIILLLIYSVVLIASTVINKGEYIAAISTIISIFEVVLLIDILVRKDFLLCCNVFLLVFEILIYINLLTIFLYPNGMYTTSILWYSTSENFFLGANNNNISYFIAALCLSFGRTYFMNGRFVFTLRNFILLIAILTSVFMCRQGTTIIALIPIVLFLVIPSIFNRFKILNSVTYLIVIILTFIIIVLMGRTSIVSPIIDMLGKSLTLSGRTTIWGYALTIIAENPVVGIGKISTMESFNLIHHMHAHNTYLQVLMTGGILQFTFFFGFIIVVVYRLFKNNNNSLAKFYSTIMLSILIVWLTEANNTYEYILLSVLYLESYIDVIKIQFDKRWDKEWKRKVLN